MKSLINRFRPHSISKQSSCRSTLTLDVERLEGRWVPATIGVNKWAMLDFNGPYIHGYDMIAGGYNTNNLSFDSFHSLFTNDRPWLDMNNSGTVNNIDANLAVKYVMAKVRADYAPYMLSVFQVDYEAAPSHTVAGSYTKVTGDVSVIITGGGDFRPGENATGTSPENSTDRLNGENKDNDLVFVFAGESVDSDIWDADPDKWLNQIARTISHEMGHAFGLQHHVSDSSGQTDPITHSLMYKGDDRDWNQDFVFLDRYFTTDGGLSQNAHHHLLKQNVLGRSYRSYISVLQPGVLTISGNNNSNTILVNELSSELWKVTVDGQQKYIYLSSDYSTLNPYFVNPFDQDISQVVIKGEGGNDKIIVAYDFTARATVFAGAGHDLVFGGAGNDRLYGGTGNDSLYGAGGGDILWGDSGNDKLFGADGWDFLFGGQGNDYLDGGNDGIADYLNGGSGKDTFIAEWYSFWGWKLNRDNPADWHSWEGDSVAGTFNK